MEKANKPWYKKWWIWVIVVILVIAVANIGGSSDANDATDTTAKAETTDNKGEDSKKEEKLDLKVTDVKYEDPEAYDTTADQYAVVTFTVKNNEYPKGVSINPLYFSLETNEESNISYSPFGDHDMSTSTLKEGIEKEYTLAFPIESGQKAESLHYSPIGGDKYSADVK